jgi:hypothetical protein
MVQRRRVEVRAVVRQNEYAMKRTRLGKVVGSYKPPLDGWTYWAEKNWTTREDSFVVVAPSGARFEWVRDEADALLIAEMRNRDENR